MDAGACTNITEVRGAVISIVTGCIDMVTVLWVVDVEAGRRCRVEVTQVVGGRVTVIAVFAARAARLSPGHRDGLGWLTLLSQDVTAVDRALVTVIAVEIIHAAVVGDVARVAAYVADTAV